jgi:hypothetical protein
MKTRRQINRHGAEEARGAHNSEDTGSKPVAGTSPYRVHRSVWTSKTRRQISRHGAEEARGTHNPEDTGSKPVAGISPYRVHRSILTICLVGDIIKTQHSVLYD